MWTRQWEWWGCPIGVGSPNRFCRRGTKDLLYDSSSLGPTLPVDPRLPEALPEFVLPYRPRYGRPRPCPSVLSPSVPYPDTENSWFLPLYESYPTLQGDSGRFPPRIVSRLNPKNEEISFGNSRCSVLPTLILQLNLSVLNSKEPFPLTRRLPGSLVLTQVTLRPIETTGVSRSRRHCGPSGR